jgi:hypothetical protein
MIRRSKGMRRFSVTTRPQALPYPRTRSLSEPKSPKWDIRSFFVKSAQATLQMPASSAMNARVQFAGALDTRSRHC